PPPHHPAHPLPPPSNPTPHSPNRPCHHKPPKTSPNIAVAERDYPSTYARFNSLCPLLDILGNGGKCIAWNTLDEVDFLGKLNYTKHVGPAKG
ncbi:hypothetical protein, partial [Salmonella enterica]|uniref:hypothetical protein n=1 Tax=Salmonella enterica TaxID=28901 RepID=UPI002892739B